MVQLPDHIKVREHEEKAVKAQEGKVRRLLNSRKDVQVERQFADAAGVKHQVKSIPVVGGRYLYDDSRSWGLRALGLCVGDGDGPAHIEALADDYVKRCSEEKRPLCRRLERDDIKRSSRKETPEAGARR
jgi:hypothetical protein